MDKKLYATGLITIGIFNAITSYHNKIIAMVTIGVYSVGWIILFIIILNCDMKWKKK